MRLIFILLLSIPIFPLLYHALHGLDVEVCSKHSFVKCSSPEVNDEGVKGYVGQYLNMQLSINAGNSGSDVVMDPMQAHAFADAEQWQWIRAPDTKLKDVLPPESRVPPLPFGRVESIVDAWNGAAWNELGQELRMLYSGGHADYPGNQDIGFNVDDLEWVVHRGPSDTAGVDYSTAIEIMPDGHPNSRHTYNGTVYIPLINGFAMIGGSLAGNAGSVSGAHYRVESDGTANLLYTRKMSQLGVNAVYDSVTDAVYYQHTGHLYKWNYNTGERSELTNYKLGATGSYRIGVAIDESRRQVLTIGTKTGWPVASYYVYQYKIDETDPHSVRVTVTKDTNLEDLSRCVGAGLVFSPELDKFIGWCGGNELYLIDPSTFATTKQSTTGVAPIKTPNGVFGRFAYSAKYGGIIMVDAVDRDVSFVKLLP